jgi:mono/diheme cytochrome c family protein
MNASAPGFLRRILAASLVWLFAGCAGEAPPASTAAPALEPRQPAAAATSGQALFASYCAPCHEPGEGMESFAPPLAASAWVAGPESRLIRLVLHGLRGPIEAGGKTYNLEMPGFGKVLTDAQVAGLLTFARGREGHDAVAAETVSRVRAQTGGRSDYWTVAELQALE